MEDLTLSTCKYKKIFKLQLLKKSVDMRIEYYKVSDNSRRM